jgi:UDP-N-acetyl-2-amino-2-deoxyglucuronate dehydrogenase
VRFGLRSGMDVICEKPLVLNPWNLDALAELEHETGKRVWNILQLRHHPQIIALKEMVQQQAADKIFDVELTYITPRGQWYYASWKGDTAKSGGITTNIGIHLFDMLIWVFGAVQSSEVHLSTHGRVSGLLQLQRAKVRWFLSIESGLLPSLSANQAFRSLRLDGQDWDFSEGFTDLHTLSYQKVIALQGWPIHEVKAGIALAHQLRSTVPVRGHADQEHPLVQSPIASHPFLKN